MKKLGMLSAALFLVMAVPALSAEPREEVDKVTAQYSQFFNKRDAAGITSLYTKKYLRVNQNGVVADNTKIYEGAFKAGFNHHENKTIDVQAVSENVIISTGEAHLTGKNDKGEPLDLTAVWSALMVPENGEWKIRELTSFPKPPAPPQQASK
jgi:ketosteroid isomerase-like protein